MSRYAEPSDLVARAPWVSGVAASVVEAALDTTREMVGGDRWGGELLSAHVLLTLHWLVRDPTASQFAPEGERGPVMSSALGPSSRSWASSGPSGGSAADATLALSSYGRAYLELLATRAPVAAVGVTRRRAWA